MRCPNCNNEIPEGKRFCGHCGHRLAPAAPEPFDDEAPTRLVPSEMGRGEPERPPVPPVPTGSYCPACGAHNRPGAQYCDACGAALEKAALVDIPEEPAVPAELPRPRARAVLPLLIMTLGWAIPMAIGDGLYSNYEWDLFVSYMDDRITRATYMASLVVPTILWGLLGGGLSGLVSGLALRRAGLSLRTKHILAMTASWAAAFTVVRLYLVFSSSVLYDMGVSGLPVIVNILLLLASLSVGALVTALALQRAERALRRKHVTAIAAVWLLAILGGLVLAGLFSDITANAYDDGAIFGAVAGAAGYGIIQWQLGRAKASR